MTDNVKLTVITNALVEYLRDKFKLSATGNQLLSMVVMNAVAFISLNLDINDLRKDIKNIFHWKYMVMFSIGIVLFYFRELIEEIIRSKFIKAESNSEVQEIKFSDEDNYIVVDISNIPRYIMAMYKYISLNPEMFDTNVNSKYIIYIEDVMLPLYNKEMYFNDTEHGIKGYITTRYSSFKEKEQIVHNYGLHIHIDKTSSYITEDVKRVNYINMILDYLERDAKYGSQVQLFYYKILHNKLIKTTYYDADINTWKKDVKLLQETFFSEHSEMLFNIINHKIKGTNIIEAQAWNNLLLYSKQGGLGKSSIIHRIAIMLKKNVVSVDLSQYINRKNDLYALFHCQKFKLPAGGDTEYDINNYIIVLEEFDHSIEKLARLDKFNNIKFELTQKHLTTKQQDAEKSADAALQQDNVLSSAKPQGVAVNSNPMQAMMERAARIGPKTTSQQLTNNIRSIDNDIQDMINTNLNPNNYDIILLGDLLELFQGPIHIVDRMIIATTK